MQASGAARLTGIVMILVGLGSSLALAPRITASAGRHGLAYDDIATDSQDPTVSLGIAMGAFRGLFANYLWLRATDLKDKGLFHESVELARAITKLQPRFPRVWTFHAWNLAYNISVETNTPEERWQWVQAGISILRDEAIPLNPKDLLLHKELAYIYLHKIGGYTDDSNRYYKRKVAETWHEIMGEPPRPSAENRSREDVITLYVETWLRPIVEAPADPAALREASPEAADLYERVRAYAEDDRDILRRWTLMSEIYRSARAPLFESSFGPDARDLADAVNDPELAGAWQALVPYLRKRVLEDDFNMAPRDMMRYTQRLGPIDWRSPAAHAIYWSARGVEQALGRVHEGNEDVFDFVNADRFTIQGVQELFRYGTISFNYLDWVTSPRGHYFATPNEHFARTYGDLSEDIIARGGVVENRALVRSPFVTGYENFLRDVVAFFYSRGDLAEAEYWQEKFRTLTDQNLHEPRRIEEAAMTLADFVAYNSYERFDSPNYTSTRVVAGIQGALDSLLRGDGDAFRAQLQFAADIHRYYFNFQFRQVIAAQGAEERMESMDRDFGFLTGGIFQQFMSALPFEEAERVYNRAPADLQRYAFDLLSEKFRPEFEQNQETRESFEIQFPEPPGMEQHRRFVQQKLEQRLTNQLEGLNNQ